MNCAICTFYNTKFTCSNCLNKEKRNHYQKLSNLEAELQNIINSLPSNVEIEEFIDADWIEKHTEVLQQELNRKKDNLAVLKNKVECAKTSRVGWISIKSDPALNNYKQPEESESSIEKELVAKQEQLTKYKRLLIQDLVLIFRLRKVQRKDKQEYRILNNSLPPLHEIPNLKESKLIKFNACFEYCKQLTTLIAKYLFIHLPCTIDDICSLNYNIVYLCFTQYLDIVQRDMFKTLDLLAMLCQSRSLGTIPRLEGFQYDLSDFTNQYHILINEKPWDLVEHEQEDEWDIL
ncbi:hypothetical protein HDV06_004478 [Boothiomyces sp. JEL0866]|nr:hypothetical protein HDV06_004478 [Boothiomyces sp. JEL0866]